MEWISVKDRLPENYINVLFFCSNRLTKTKREALEERICIGKYCNCKGWIQKFPPTHIYFDRDGNTISQKDLEKCLINSEITHWMPLPDNPE